MRIVTTAICAIVIAAVMASVSAQTSPPGTLDRVHAAGTIKFGYRPDARPFAFQDQAGRGTGYSLGLCEYIADAVKTELKQPSLKVEWIPVTAADRFGALQRGTIDLLCGADTITLSRRTQVAFSLPIFPGGVGVLLRRDAPVRLKDVLSGKGQTFQPTWRAQASQVLRARDFAAVTGTTTQTWLVQRIKDLEILTNAVAVPSYDAGIEAVLSRRVDALFGERAILLGIARSRVAQADVVVLDRLFTNEPLALVLRTNDEPFQLLVDRTLTRVYAAGGITRLYSAWFGEPDQSTVDFFRWVAVPE